MVLGSNIQTTVTNVVNDENFRTSITLTPITRFKGNKGGYYGENAVEGTEVSTYGIPASYIKTRLGMQKFGDLKEGEMRIIIKGTETIDTNYIVTMDSVDYDVVEVKPLYFNDVTVAFVLRLSKRE